MYQTADHALSPSRLFAAELSAKLIESADPARYDRILSAFLWFVERDLRGAPPITPGHAELRYEVLVRQPLRQRNCSPEERCCVLGYLREFVLRALPVANDN
ncbi:MAG TPA: hypothetical protein VEA36_01455 [Candidatus Paceibacterota bacterium]|nr:hypothetical protein [Candidatus Paceibacterota bacterium]